jgi:hypothetical protein
VIKQTLRKKSLRKDKRWWYSDQLINQEELMPINLYSPSKGTFDFIKQTLLDLKWEISLNAIILGESILSFQ